MDNYKRAVYYVQNPFIKELKFNTIPISNFAQIHFYEVKRIFIALYIFSIAFVIVMLIKMLSKKNDEFRKNIINSFSKSTNMIALIFIFVSASAAIDFDKTFYFFHKIFFRNNYWIFDPDIDPIINALPEELFAIELGLIAAVLAIFTIIVKTLNRKIKTSNS